MRPFVLLLAFSGAVFAASPAVEIGPVAGAPGTTVRIVGEGFPANRPLVIGAGPPASEYEVIARIRSTAGGRIDARVEVPAWASGHDRLIFVAASPDARLKVRSIPFAIEPPAQGRVSATGVVTTEGVECPLIVTDDGGRYTLVGTDVRNLVPGDRIRIEGTVAEISFCMQGTTVAVERLTYLERALRTH